MKSIGLILGAFAFVLASTFTTMPSAYANDMALECKRKTFKARGKPNNIQSMANLSAVVTWISRAKKKHGKEYAQWHYAAEHHVKCEKKTNFYMCEAIGKPCKGPDKTAQK